MTTYVRNLSYEICSKKGEVGDYVSAVEHFKLLEKKEEYFCRLMFDTR